MKKAGTHSSPRQKRFRFAFTLVELVLSVSICAILFLTLAGMIGVTSQAIPDQKGSMIASIRAGRIIDRIATELESAIYVSDRGANRIAFTVADRDGDGHPERIRYAWSGVARDPLTRQYNDNAPVSVIDDVYLFTLNAANKATAQSYPGVGVEDSESLLIGLTASPNGAFNITSSASCGQYLSPDLPGKAIGWRPTLLRIKAAINNNPGLCSVQLRTSNANLTPTSTIMEQYTLDSTGLSTGTFVDYPLSTTTVQAPGAGLCLVIAYTSGTGPKISLCNNSAGEVTCNPTQTPVAWTYKTTNSLLCQMFGKVTLASGTQYLNSRYFTSVGIALQAGSSSNPTVQTSSVMLNHPEYLSNRYELLFDTAPTAVDVNGDGIFDWVVRGGGSIPAGSISGGNWTTTNTILDTPAGSDFANATVIDLRLRSTTSGSTPGISLNALRNGSTCAPLNVSLQLQADGTQTLIVAGKTSDSTNTTLLNKPGLSNALNDVRLIIDPVTVSVGVILNTVPVGTYPLPRFVSSDPSRTVSLHPGGGGQFQYVRVREIDPNP
jgi:hypothetical protein